MSDALANAIIAVGAPIANAGITLPSSAISPAAGYVVAGQPITARRAVALLRQIATEITMIEVLGEAAEAVVLAARVALIAQAVRAAADISYESRQDATAVRSALDADLAALADATALAAYDDPALGATLWRAIGDLRAALSRDLHEIIGRLPAVITITVPYGMSTWLVAQHFAGNDPRRVQAMFDDIVRRNRLPHPGMITLETIEVLP